MTNSNDDRLNINLEGASIDHAQFGNHNRMNIVETKSDDKNPVKRRIAKVTIAIALFVFGVGITLAANVATSIIPKSLNPYLWLSWPLLIILTIVSAILMIKQ